MYRHILLYILFFLVGTTSAQAQRLDDFLTAAREGDALAQYNAAVCYYHGFGVERNIERSNYFLRRAAEGGAAEAKAALSSRHAGVLTQLASYLQSGSSTETRYMTYEGYDNGCYYGQMHGGWRDGYGTYLWDSGVSFVGQWEDGECFGMGRTIYGDQTHYGSYINLPHGYGAIIMADTLHHPAGCPGGARYVGFFASGEPSGTGTIYNAAGEVLYFGEFDNGRPAGEYPSSESYSTYRWVEELLPTGDTYNGETHNGVREGFGIYRWAAGALWFGYWRDGLRNGDGLYIDADGRMIAGVWLDDEFQE